MADSSKPQDLLNRWTVPLGALTLALPIWAGRQAPRPVAAIAGTIAVFCALWTVDRLEGRRRMILGTIAAIFGCYTIAVIWPWSGPALIVPIGLPLFAMWCVGSGHQKRVIPKAAARLIC
jgi:hypothetical protein